MNKSEPVFPREAMQMASDPQAALEILTIVTEELPFTHRSDWIVVDLMKQTLFTFVQEKLQEAKAKSEAEQSGATEPAADGMVEEPKESAEPPKEEKPPGPVAVPNPPKE